MTHMSSPPLSPTSLKEDSEDKATTAMEASVCEEDDDEIRARFLASSVGGRRRTTENAEAADVSHFTRRLMDLTRRRHSLQPGAIGSFSKEKQQKEPTESHPETPQLNHLSGFSLLSPFQKMSPARGDESAANTPSHYATSTVQNWLSIFSAGTRSSVTQSESVSGKPLEVESQHEVNSYLTSVLRVKAPGGMLYQRFVTHIISGAFVVETSRSRTTTVHLEGSKVFDPYLPQKLGLNIMLPSGSVWKIRFDNEFTKELWWPMLIRQCGWLKGKEGITMSHRFVALCVLGLGSFGKVLKVRHKVTAETYAMKVVAKSHVVRAKIIPHVIAERQVLTYLQGCEPKCPFIIQLCCTFQTSNHLYFVLEFCMGGELSIRNVVTSMFKAQRLSEDQALTYFLEIVAAVHYLHTHNIMHRDIKLDNLMLDAYGHIKLTDFGLSAILPPWQEGRDTDVLGNWCAGTLEYMSPELLRLKALKLPSEIRKQGYDRRADWWSVGVLLYALLTGSLPYMFSIRDDTTAAHEKITSPNALHFPDYLSSEARNIIGGLLNPDFSQRIMSAEEIIKDPFVQKHFQLGDDWYDKVCAKGLLKPPFVPDTQHGMTTKYFDQQFTKLNPLHRHPQPITPTPEEEELLRSSFLDFDTPMVEAESPTSPLEGPSSSLEATPKTLSPKSPSRERGIHSDDSTGC